MYRYDGRGALGDLRIHEPPAGGFDQRIILTEDELKVEQLCDEERYRSLYNNDAEDSMYHGMFRLHVFKAFNIDRCSTSELIYNLESLTILTYYSALFHFVSEEEMKRLHQALDSENSYTQVGYNYNEDENNSKLACEDSQSPKQSEGSQEEDQAFVPPADLEIPEGMTVVRDRYKNITYGQIIYGFTRI